MPVRSAIPAIPSVIDSTMERRAWGIYPRMVAIQIATRALPDGEVLQSYVIEEHDDAFHVVLSRAVGEEAGADYEVDVFLDGRVEVTAHDAPVGLSLAQQSQLRALEAVIKDDDDRELCGIAHTVFVLPNEEEPGWVAYLIALPEEPGRMPLAGHYRYELDPSGALLLARTRLGPGCEAFTLPAGAEAFIIYLVDPAREPVETDMLESLLYDIPLLMKAASAQLKVWGISTHGIRDVTEEFFGKQ